MYVVGALVIVEDNMSSYIIEEILKRGLAEAPATEPNNSFVCVIEAKDANEIVEKISQIKAIDSVICVEKIFGADEDEIDEILSD